MPPQPQSHTHAPGSAAFSRSEVTALRGDRGGSGSRFAIVVARFNQGVTDALYNAAVDVLLDAGARPERITAVQVPGAIEIPIATRELAETGHYGAIIVLGCVVRGETSHFDYVCSSVTDGCLRVQLDHGIPIGFGVITAENNEQAYARADSRASGGGQNVGADAAYAALEMTGLLRIVRGL